MDLLKMDIVFRNGSMSSIKLKHGIMDYFSFRLTVAFKTLSRYTLRLSLYRLSYNGVNGSLLKALILRMNYSQFPIDKHNHCPTIESKYALRMNVNCLHSQCRLLIQHKIGVSPEADILNDVIHGPVKPFVERI